MLPTDSPPRLVETLCAARRDSLALSLTNDGTWNDWLDHGEAERAIGGDHAGRYWLELLQNARDALRQRGKLGRRRVWMGVTDTGLIIANDGAPFALHEAKVMDAVCRIGQSTKRGVAGMVGHKGIGLKSVLLRSEGMEVRSRVGADADPIRVAFRRSRTRATIEELLCGQSPHLAARRRSQLGQIPLFRLPHELHEEADPEGGLLEDLLVDGSPRRQAPEGLDENGALAPLPAFDTVVYLPFADGDAAADRAADRAWAELAEVGEEVLIALGELAEVHRVRVVAGHIAEARRFDIHREEERATAFPGVLARTVATALHTWPPPAERHAPGGYLEVEAPGPVDPEVVDRDGKHEPTVLSLLVPIPRPDGPPRGPNRPLALYYPIEHAPTGLPFLLHGPFRVTPNRKELADDPFNAEVLAAALPFVLAAAEHAASAHSPLRLAMPWAFAPRLVEGVPDVVAAFVGNVRAALREAAICPDGATGTRRAAHLLFDGERPQAFEVVRDALGHAVLGADAVGRYLAWHQTAPREAEPCADALGLGLPSTGDEARRCAEKLVGAFRAEGATRAVRAPRACAVDWFDALGAWLARLERPAADEVASVFVSGALPLVPAASDVPDEDTQLVRAERDLPGVRPKRVLFWRKPGEDGAVDVPSPPPDLPVFVADLRGTPHGAEALARFGLGWGATRLRELPDLFRRVADRLADLPDSHPDVLAYLARVMTARSERGGPSPDLRPVPYAAVDPRPVMEAWSKGDATDVALRRRYGGVRLPDADGRPLPAGRLAFSAGWSPVLASFGDDGARWGEVVARMDTVREGLAGAAPVLAPPSSDAWAAFRLLWPTEGEPWEQALARLCLVLGVAVGPVVECPWAAPHADKDDTASDRVGVAAASRASTLRRVVDDVEQDWLADVWSTRWHPASGWHTPACPWHRRAGPSANRLSVQAVVVARPHAPELASPIPVERRADLAAALTGIGPELAPLLRTWWFCHGHHGTGADGCPVIPSPLRRQLARLPIWRPVGTPEGTWAPADQLTAWREEVEDEAQSAAATLPRWRPSPDDDRAARLARDLGIVGVEDLDPMGAWRRLRHLLVGGAAPSGGAIALPPPASRTNLWVGAVNLLMRQVLARTHDLDGDTLVRWRVHDLGLLRGVLLARQGDRYFGLPVIAETPGAPARIATPVQVYRQRPPAAARNSLVLISEGGFQARYASLASGLGATPSTPPPPPDLPGARSGGPRAELAREQFREAVGARLHLLVGVLSVRRESVDADAVRLRDALDALVAHEGHGPDPTSGLAGGRLAFSIEAWQRATDRGGPVGELLARGLAQLVGAASYRRDFQYALSAPESEVVASLEDDEVSVDELVRDIEVLVSERERRRRVRGERFDVHLAPLLMGADPSRIARLRSEAVDGVAVSAAREWCAEFAALASSALPHEACRALVELAGAGTIADLGAAADRALARLCAATALAASHADDRQPPVEPLLSARWTALGRLDWWSTGEELLDALGLVGRSVPIEPGAVVGWDEPAWARVEHAGRALLDAEGPLPGHMRALIEAGNVGDMLAALRSAAAEVRREVVSVRANWLSRELAPPGPPAAEPVVEVVPVSLQSAGGGGGGAGDPVRGDAGEAAMLRWGWQRFLALSPEERERLVDALHAVRTDGGPLWTTGPGGERAAAALRDRRQALIQRTPEPGPPDEAFLALVNVAEERGPGFDLLDWRDPPWTGGRVPLLRVEVKAVAARASATFRLTTNEYHKASVDGASYVLRVVEIPRVEEPAAHLLHEIVDPVERLDLRARFGHAVRGGHAVFRL